MKTRLKGLSENQLKRNSFVHESKKLSRQFHDRLPQSTLPFFPPDMSEPWVTDITDTKVHTTVPSLSGGNTQDNSVKQFLILAGSMYSPMGQQRTRCPTEGQVYWSTSQEDRKPQQERQLESTASITVQKQKPSYRLPP